MKSVNNSDDAYRKFVRAWESAVNVSAVAKKMGIDSRKASFTASFLRRHGVTLKRFRRGRNVDYAGLNSIVTKASVAK